MDIRVLAAVFLTLFAVAIGMAQGNVEVGDIQQSLDGLRTGVDLSDALADSGNASDGSRITGTITSPDSVDVTVGAPARVRFTAGGDTTFRVGGSSVEPAADTSIRVDGFQGDIHISPDNLSVSGAVTGFSTEQIAFDYDQATEFTAALETPDITVEGLQRQPLRFGNASGTVSSDTTDIQVDGEQAVFQGFTGNLSVDQSTYTLEGTVVSAALGDARIE